MFCAKPSPAHRYTVSILHQWFEVVCVKHHTESCIFQHHHCYGIYIYFTAISSVDFRMGMSDYIPQRNM